MESVFIHSMLQLLVTAYVVHSSPILVVMMVEAIRSFEKSVLGRATWRHIAENGVVLFHYCCVPSLQWKPASSRAIN
jgi:hypothetical protein